MFLLITFHILLYLHLTIFRPTHWYVSAALQRCSGALPSTASRSGSAPWSKSRRTQMWWPPEQASCKAVRPPGSASTSAPLNSSSSTQPEWPLLAARRSADVCFIFEMRVHIPATEWDEWIYPNTPERMCLCVLKGPTHLRGPRHLLMYSLHQCIYHAWLFEDGIHSLHISTHEGIVDGWVSALYLGWGSTDRLDPLVSMLKSGGGRQRTSCHCPPVCQCPPGILPVLKLLIQP